MVLVLIVLQHGHLVHVAGPAQVVNSSELSDGDSIHTGEPLPYQF